jgi:hypothetical protein
MPSAATCECFLTCRQLEQIHLLDSAAHAPPKFDTSESSCFRLKAMQISLSTQVRDEAHINFCVAGANQYGRPSRVPNIISQLR